MIVVWLILACLTSGAIGATLMALLQIAKQAGLYGDYFKSCT